MTDRMFELQKSLYQLLGIDIERSTRCVIIVEPLEVNIEVTYFRTEPGSDVWQTFLKNYQIKARDITPVDEEG